MRPDPGKTGAGAAAVAEAREREVGGGVGPAGGGVGPAGASGTLPGTSTAPPRGLVLKPNLAGVVHLVTLVGALAFWAWRDGGLWFFGDEWDFLVDRGLGYAPGSTHSIWFPHNEHWSTLPVLAWRALYSVWHLSSYWPYLALLLAVQALALHLAWRACRRAGADPWVATAAATLLALLGAGAQDFGWAFQVGFVGSVMFGLLALDLLDRLPPAPAPPASGPVPPAPAPAPGRAGALSGVLATLPRGRDLAASAALLASLMCSTIGDAMVVGAAVLAFARLSRARAVRMLWPPVACYVVWFAGVGRLGIVDHSDHFDLTTFTSLPAYVWDGLSSALGQTFNYDALGPALLAGLAVWVAWHGRRLWSQRPLLLALSASALCFYALAALGRDTSGSADASRYVYVAMAVLLPLVAVVLSGWRNRGSTVERVAAVGLLAFTALGNVGQAETFTASQVALTSRLKTQLEAVGELVAAGVPDVSGPKAAPVPGDPNLQVADIARLEKERLLAKPHLSRLDTTDARAVLALGVWDGVDMTLSRTPLSGARFQLAKTSFGDESSRGANCVTFTPETVSPAMQIWLRVPAGESSASVLLQAGPAPGGTSRHAGASLAQPPSRPGTGGAVLISEPVTLAVPAKGTGYLDDDDPGSLVVLTWAAGTPLSLCGLLPGRR